jgi:hypothetical protein
MKPWLIGVGLVVLAILIATLGIAIVMAFGGENARASMGSAGEHYAATIEHLKNGIPVLALFLISTGALIWRRAHKRS